MKYYERHTKGTFSALRNILYERFVMDFLSPLDYTAWQRIDTNRLQYMGIPERNNIKEYVGIFRYSDNDAKVEIVLAYNEEQAEAKLHKLSDWNNDRYELRIYKRTL